MDKKQKTLAVIAGAAALYLLSTNRAASPYGTGGTSTWGGGGTSPYSRFGTQSTGFGVQSATGTGVLHGRGRRRMRRL